ncbi:hypothetical protein SDC9_195668 [bioreactor metagenome]|uniref:Uncharacterized protein n=1 Tax=bioreactor metagenome TaxID=1076179 RepID=A0A645IIC6_9ZZZZ
MRLELVTLVSLSLAISLPGDRTSDRIGAYDIIFKIYLLTEFIAAGAASHVQPKED